MQIAVCIQEAADKRLIAAVIIVHSETVQIFDIAAAVVDHLVIEPLERQKCRKHALCIAPEPVKPVAVFS